MLCWEKYADYLINNERNIMYMNTVVITGVTGFIGNALADRLLKRGIEVYGVGRSEDKFKELERYSLFHKIVLDFEQYSDLHKYLENKNIDCFFHAAHRGVNGSKKSDYRIQIQNLGVACETVKQAIMTGCKRYMFIGSVDEYEISNTPDSLFTKPTHSRIYAAAKFSSEIVGKTLAYDNKLEYVSALLSLTYGEGNATNILPNTLIRNCESGTPTNLIIGSHYFDMIYIDEAIDAIISVALNGKAYESYYIGHHQLKTFKEIVLLISDIIGNSSELKFGTYPEPSFSIDYSLIDRMKLARDTGYTCNFDFSESIIRTKKWILHKNEFL